MGINYKCCLGTAELRFGGSGAGTSVGGVLKADKPEHRGTGGLHALLVLPSRIVPVGRPCHYLGHK